MQLAGSFPPPAQDDLKFLRANGSQRNARLTPSLEDLMYNYDAISNYPW